MKPCFRQQYNKSYVMGLKISKRAVVNINSFLPAEMLERIFRELSPRDMKTVVLVCRRWREVGEAQGLWAWVVAVHRGLAVTRRSPPKSVVPRLLETRLWAVRVIFVRAVSKEILEAVAGQHGLRVMHMEDTNLTLVDSRLLARAVSKLEDVNMQKSSIDFWQAETIFKAVGRSSILRKLNIASIDLSLVNAETLALAVNNLDEVSLFETCLTPLQVDAVLYSIRDDSKLRRLNLGENLLISVKSDNLAKSVNKLEYLSLYKTYLTVHHGTAILVEITKHSNLKMLDLGGNRLTKIDPCLLARAVNLLEDARLYGTFLSKLQAEAILKQSLLQTKLRSLHIGMVCEGVNRDLILKARVVIGDLSVCM